MFIKRFLCSGLFALVGASAISHADDTELYVVDTGAKSDRIPKVLIVFDNSNSMSTIEEDSPGAYAPGWAPDGFDYSGYINEKAIYWNRGGIDNTNSASTPLQPNESRRFNVDSNGCAESWEILSTKGRYTGYIREFRKKSWEEVAENNGLNDNKFDCLADINAGNDTNAVGSESGYPIDRASMYTNDVDKASTSFGKGQPITLYTTDYLIWYQWVTGQVPDDGNTPPPVEVESRLNTAKSALKSALGTLGADIEVGLAVFNLNSHALRDNDPQNDADFVDEGMRDGGRIVSGIKKMTDTNQSALFTLIDGMPAETNTPLCETLFEAHQYLSGGSVVFGNQDSNTGNNANPSDYVSSPLRDTTIESNGSYISPFKTCPEMAYVIYMTDGSPTVDNFADDRIKALTDTAENKTADYSPFEFEDDFGNTAISYLPALASYMYNNDLVKGNVDSTGNDNQQSARLFTIGFSDGADKAAALLKEAARRGGNIHGGGYYIADDALTLEGVFDDILKTILSIDSSYTSPSIASNNFDKTQTFNSAYYAMFLPSKGPRWAGNLKKLKVTADGVLVKPGKLSPVVDDLGSISAQTCTFWSKCNSGPDGNKVKQGGVIESLQGIDGLGKGLLNRKIFTGTSTVSLNVVKNLPTSEAATLLGLDPSDGANITSHINWIYGLDVDDDDGDKNFTEGRDDIMGDPLHSKPLALNFGSKSTPDVRIILGTNQGLVHMFRDYDKGSDDFESGKVEESWAYIPPELMKNIPVLKANIETGSHSVYGMDSSPVAYTKLTATGEIETAWVFIGMRRGGRSYYAMDVSNPDAPEFMWQIKSEGVFAELGQTWSEPVVTTIPTSTGQSEPVLIFGGGYDSASSLGNAIYIVKAKDGTLIDKISATGMDSIPNKVAVLDSNNDGITDRIYASDVSANIWRIDLFPSKSPSVFKFASLDSGSNRKFFNEPVVAQTQFTNISKTSVDGNTTVVSQNIPYDAVTIGSGNRPHPLDKITQDSFFVLQDRTVNITDFNAVTPPSAIGLDDLYDVTTSAPAPDDEAQNLIFGSKKGWIYQFSGTGEKSLSASLIFDGKVYFTSFIPPSTSVENLDLGICGISGKGRLYVFDLHKGTRTYSEVFYDLGERVPDTPQIVIPAPENEGDESKAYVIGIGKGECENGQCKGTIELGSGLGVNKIYYHMNE
ncbi:pilus assembly protein [Shewanella marisflavi]|uniref:pilus assembly protein n=1 Tax=Shewanella marisflavi TaxID=260364 RepID=UPI003AAE3D17